MIDRYILVGRTPVPEPDLMIWARWYEDSDRKVGDWCSSDGQVRVSTVFLGLDHNYTMDGPPIVFESMVFGGPLDGEMDRYATWDEAERGHGVLVARVIGLGAKS